TRFYVANQRVGPKQFLYLAWERVQDPSGTTNMDFEFNQSTTLSSNGVTPVRTEGDILIKYDLSQGGTNPVLGYHRWVISGDPLLVCEASLAVPCWDKVHSLSGEFEGAVNPVVVTDPIQPGALTPATFSLQDNGVITYTSVFAGPYTVSESDPAALGFDLGSLSCAATSASKAITSVLTRTASIDLAASGVVDCTFTNRKRG